MGAYVLMVFSGDGQLAGLETLFAADDALAALTAPTLLPPDDAAGRVEVWRDAALVSTIGYDPAAADWGV